MFLGRQDATEIVGRFSDDFGTFLDTFCAFSGPQMVNFQPQLQKLAPKIAKLVLGRENLRKFALREGFRTILGGPRAPKRVPKGSPKSPKTSKKEVRKPEIFRDRFRYLFL